MFIDIDIKISDNDGKLLHRFEKQFDEDIAYPEKLNNNYLGEDFEGFLSEYMSSRGLAMRERLISDYYAVSSDHSTVDSSDGLSLMNNETFDPSDSEMEIKIRIGRKNVFIGRVPMKQLYLTNEPDNIYMKLEREKETPASSICFKKKRRKTKKSILSEKQTLSSFDTLPSLDSKNEAALDIMINYAMIKAIEKYEANLYPSNCYEEADCLEEEPTEVLGCP